MRFKVAYSNPYQAYNDANKIQSDAEKIVILYRSAFVCIKQAKKYDENKNHDLRYQCVDKASSIFHGLRACIVDDNDAAESLNSYYESLEEMLLSVQCRSDNRQEMFDVIINNISILKDAWEGVSDTEMPCPTYNNNNNLNVLL